MTKTAVYQCTCCICWSPISFLRGNNDIEAALSDNMNYYIPTITLPLQKVCMKTHPGEILLCKQGVGRKRAVIAQQSLAMMMGSHSPAKPDIMTCWGFAGLWLPGLARHLSVLYGRLPVWQRLPCELVASLTFWLLVQAPLWWSILHVFHLFNVCWTWFSQDMLHNNLVALTCHGYSPVLSWWCSASSSHASASISHREVEDEKKDSSTICFLFGLGHASF